MLDSIIHFLVVLTINVSSSLGLPGTEAAVQPDLVPNKVMICHLGKKRVFRGRIGLDPQVKVGRKDVHGFKFFNVKKKRMNTVYANSCTITDHNLL